MNLTGITKDGAGSISSNQPAGELTLRERLSRYFRGRYFRGVMVLAGGAALGQLVTLTSTLVLTRIYAPEDFGVLAVFVSVVAVLATNASLRFEMAIPLPEKQAKAVDVLALCFICLFCSMCLLVLVQWLLGDWILSIFEGELLKPYLWLLPLGVMGVGAYQVLAFWEVRRQDYANLANASVTQALGQAGAQIGLGAAGLGASGLIFGEVLGRFGGAATMLRSLRSRWRDDAQALTMEGIVLAARRYWRFPLISSWAALVNTLSVQAPLVLLAFFYDLRTVGCVALSQRVLGAPTSLLSNSVAKVFMGECAKKGKEESGELSKLFWKTILNQASLSLLLVICVALPAPWIVPLVFGEQWELAGWCVLLLSLTYGAKMIAFPLGSALDVLERQGLHLIRESFRLILTGFGRAGSGR